MDENRNPGTVVLKYRILKKEKKFYIDRTLYRIQAMRAFGDVQKGDRGGWIERYFNLSQEGNAWIYDNGMVWNNGQVIDDGRVTQNGMVSGNGIVAGDGQVSGSAKVFQDGRVYGKGNVTDQAKVREHGQVFDEGTVADKSDVCGGGKVYGKGRLVDRATVGSDGELFGKSEVGGRVTIHKAGRVYGESFLVGEFTVNENICDTTMEWYDNMSLIVPTEEETHVIPENADGEVQEGVDGLNNIEGQRDSQEFSSEISSSIGNDSNFTYYCPRPECYPNCGDDIEPCISHSEEEELDRLLTVQGPPDISDIIMGQEQRMEQGGHWPNSSNEEGLWGLLSDAPSISSRGESHDSSEEEVLRIPLNLSERAMQGSRPQAGNSLHPRRNFEGGNKSSSGSSTGEVGRSRSKTF